MTTLAPAAALPFRCGQLVSFSGSRSGRLETGEIVSYRALAGGQLLMVRLADGRLHRIHSTHCRRGAGPAAPEPPRAA